MPSPVVEDVLVSLPSHELRAPLSSMVGLAELIDSGDVTDDQRQRYAGILLREGRRLTSLVENALALQSLETGHRELDRTAADLGSLIHRAVAAAGEDVDRPITVEWKEALPPVSVDPEAILEVFANFFSNARRFSPDGGAILVSAHAAGDMVEICIADHGVGIEAEALPKLFRKFYRTASTDAKVGVGAGLGLSMNHRIVEAHGGRITAGSMGAGKGARFQFTLPQARVGEMSPDVLIIEDDAAFARLMKAEFATVGLSTARAADAESAWQILAGVTPRAIILDLALPGIQGEEFLARMPNGPDQRLPLVVLTVKDLQPGEISALESAGAIAVLPKEAGAPQAAVTLIAEALAAADAVAG